MNIDFVKLYFGFLLLLVISLLLGEIYIVSVVNPRVEKAVDKVLAPAVSPSATASPSATSKVK